MQKKQLLAYLETAIALESAIDQHEQAVILLTRKRSTLCREITIKQEVVEKPYGSWDVFRPFGLITRIRDANDDCCFGDSAGCFITIVLTIILAIPLFVASLINAVILCFKNIEISAKYNEEKNIAYSEYRQALLMEKKRQAAETNLEIIVDGEINKLSSNKQALENRLSALYELNLLYPTYRNFIAVSQIYDYLASGICDVLEGATGAYAQYMQDVRTARICASIEEMRRDISSKLDTIIRNQMTIGRIMQANNELLNHIDGQLGDITKNLNETNRLLAQQSVSTSAYLSSIGSELRSISEGVNRTALNSSISEMNAIRAREEAGYRSYMMQYPR